MLQLVQIIFVCPSSALIQPQQHFIVAAWLWVEASCSFKLRNNDKFGFLLL